MKINPLVHTLSSLLLGGTLLMSCADEQLSERVYNQGDHLLPVPAAVQYQAGQFELNEATRFYVASPEAQSVADFYADKLFRSTGYVLSPAEEPEKNCIILQLDSLNTSAGTQSPESYTLDVTSDQVVVKAQTPQGLFYGLATFMQLLPAEVESPQIVRGNWTAPAVHIADAPRFTYRGLMLDVARHFTSVEGLKKHIDLLATFKINRLHLHLTDYQGWRIEIKKYPKLTEVGARRTDEYGQIYSGYYTQDEMREIVAYAAQRYVTIIPEIDVPGHTLAAIASYPNLSCTGDQYEVMSRWGFFPVVFCPGKEDMFTFIDDVFAELSQIFPSPYFHIGGDECPKGVWKNCPACQQRIRQEHLTATGKHTAEERLQSYAIARCEQILHKYGKKLIGWDEILQGGLAPDATVMSWRGDQGGISAALMNHQAIMTPNAATYLDHYQGDYLAEPFAWGGYAPIRKAYTYEPVADTLKAMGKDHYIIGIQGNLWSECCYTESQVEYQTYPRILAVAETGWSQPEYKNFEDFSRRLDHAAARMDYHGIHYHIPMPEQPGGSFNHLAFTDTLSVAFTSTRPVRMVYTLDGSEPDTHSAVYTGPLRFDADATLKIRSVLPSGTMSRVRTIDIDRQTYGEPVRQPQGALVQGLQLKIADAHCTYSHEMEHITNWKDSVLTDLNQIAHLRPNFFHNVDYHVAVAEGYVDLPEDGVYQFKSNNTRVWLNDQLVVDNDNKPQIHSTTGRMLALRAGRYPFKVEQISNFIGGWNAQHRNKGNVSFKLYQVPQWTDFNGDLLLREAHR